MPTVTKRRPTVAALGVRLNRWDDCGGYDVYDRRTGERIGEIVRRGGEFGARRAGRELGEWSTRYAAVVAVVSVAR